MSTHRRISVSARIGAGWTKVGIGRHARAIMAGRQAATPGPAPLTAAERKLQLLRKTGLFGNDTRGTIIQRATSADDLRKAYCLVHRAYLNTGFITPETSGMRVRIFELSSETATFIAKTESGEVVGVLSVVGDSPDLGLPSDAAFMGELDGLRAHGGRLCELTNQAVDEEYRKSAVATELMRCALAHALTVGYRTGVATISPSHNGFYDLLGFRQVGGERSYSDKVHDPVVALITDFEQYRQPPPAGDGVCTFIRHFLWKTNPYLGLMADWNRAAKRQFLDPALLTELFVSRRNFLAECSRAELDILRLRWGQELFALVAGADAAHSPGVGQSAAPFADASAYRNDSLPPFLAVAACLGFGTHRARQRQPALPAPAAGSSKGGHIWQWFRSRVSPDVRLDSKVYS